MDATELWAIPHGSLAYVYGEHFLEHLPIGGALACLSHAGRALHRGGRLRLSTPNLEWVLATHFDLDGPGEQRRRQPLVVNRAFHEWGRHFLWSRALLDHVLDALGFEDVTEHRYGESDDPQLCGLERHGSATVTQGRPNVLIVEATRGKRAATVPPELEGWLREEFVRHVEAGH